MKGVFSADARGLAGNSRTRAPVVCGLIQSRQKDKLTFIASKAQRPALNGSAGGKRQTANERSRQG